MTMFCLPDLGEGLQEAQIVAWQVAVGDHVIADQPLVSVETDKAVVEIPAPYSGTINTLMGKAGDIIATGAPLVEISTGKAKDRGAIVGDLKAANEVVAKPSSQTSPKAAPKHSQPTVRAMPAVRKLAKEKGVDLTTLTGSGPGGSILSTDIVAAAPGLIKGQELRGIRRAMAKAMTRSHASVVPATVTDRADIHRWLPDEDPTHRLVKAIATACALEPALNAWFDGKRRQLHDQVDLALAVDTPDGLFAPVLRSVENADDIPQQIAALAKAVKARSISPGQMKNATFTLSNFGMIGGEHASLVVMPPQVAILGAGRITDTYLVVDGAPAMRKMLPLSLTFDHRVVTGGEAARFLTAICADLEHPTQREKD